MHLSESIDVVYIPVNSRELYVFKGKYPKDVCQERYLSALIILNWPKVQERFECSTLKSGQLYIFSKGRSYTKMKPPAGILNKGVEH